MSENTTAHHCVTDLQNLQAEFPDKTISRNFYRANGCFSEADWGRHFGTFAEFRRQAGLTPVREENTYNHQLATHISRDHYRSYFKEEVIPNIGKYEKPDNGKDLKTIVVSSDHHGQKCDPFALHIFLDVCRRLQPSVVVCNGDVLDCYAFGKYDIDPRRTDVAAEVRYIKEKLWRPLRAMCPNAQIDWTWGNHEHRLNRHLAAKAPYVQELLSDVAGLSMASLFGLDEFKINLVSKFDLAAFRDQDIKAEINQNYKVYYDAFVVGHHEQDYGLSGTSGHLHKPLTKVTRNLNGVKTWTQTGSMCKGNDEYIFGQSTNIQGFMIAHIHAPTKEVVTENITINDSFAVAAGKYYFRESA